MEISFSMSDASITRISSELIVLIFYLSIVHQKSPPLLYSLPMYLEISRLTWVKKSVLKLAESKMNPRTLRPSHVPLNLGVAGGPPRDVFVGTEGLDFCWFLIHCVAPPVPNTVDGAASGSTFVFLAMVSV